AKIGQRIEVIIDDVQDNIAVARSWADAPEIDGLVHIQDGEALSPGDIVEVRVVEATEHDLIAITGQAEAEGALLPDAS
ncbi:MAG: 30S ribosomal protein S12 methylthiotransferase RimO, partial [Casimicrobiaceae bacterium]